MKCSLCKREFPWDDIESNDAPMCYECAEDEYLLLNGFNTCRDAWDYCEKYGLNNVLAGDSFKIAEALLRAFNDGAKTYRYREMKKNGQ